MKKVMDSGALPRASGEAPLVAGSAPFAEDPRPFRVPPAGLAARLIPLVEKAGVRGLIHIARSENEADEIARSFAGFMPEAELVLLPPWDCLPFDRVMPSRESMGRRVAAIDRIAQAAAGPRLVVVSLEAAAQRLPKPDCLASGFIALAAGDRIDRDALSGRLTACGYLADDRIDEAGEVAFLGQVIDLFPADRTRPVRIVLDDDDRIREMRVFHPVSQRTEEAIQALRVGPASELLVGAEEEGAGRSCMEDRLAIDQTRICTLFDLLPEADLTSSPGVDERAETVFGLIAEAHEARTELGEGRSGNGRALYLTRSEFEALLEERKAQALQASGIVSVPRFASEADPLRSFAVFAEKETAAARRLLLAGPENERIRITRSLKRRLDRDVEAVKDWTSVGAAEPGVLLQASFDLAEGFTDEDGGITVVAAPDISGARIFEAEQGREPLITEPELGLNDVVLHEDHGIGVIRALESVEVDGTAHDTVRLEYHGGTSLLVPVNEFGRIWRYGAEEDAVTLDRLNNGAWQRRRVEIHGEIARTAAHLVALGKARDEEGAETIEPPRGPYKRFATRFPYPETPDQSAAIQAVLDDLRAGRAMNRLVCGDVGYGKTEVAMRAAAAVALSGGQAAVVAPTTVLVRQHFESFARRFAGTGIEVAQLSRNVDAAEAERVKEGLASGAIGVVLATSAVAAADVRFAGLKLLVIDEEHRFGVRMKETLRSLAPRLHVLSMSATPIPRTLRGAMVGVQETSVLANPPARRRPVRTSLGPFDAATVRTALLREKRRGGQSFVVVPRIADIEATENTLREIAPDLSVLVAHGDLDPKTLDDVMIRFSNGDGDVLLATSIIETGLDVPRANTMLVAGAERFGLAQLHQLRGRVGRGRVQGIIYLMTESDEIPEQTRSRLSTLVAFDRLGSGLAISARDLDLRGAGDLVGEEQAGHMKMIGVSLYQRLLAHAVAVEREGAARAVSEAVLNLGMTGAFPPDYVPEPAVRLNLYSRLQRFTEADEVAAFAGEVEDRFGPVPEPVSTLMALARLKLQAGSAGVAKIDAGPKAVAIDFARKPSEKRWGMLEALPGCERRGDRLVCEAPTEAGPARLGAVGELLDRIETKAA